MPRPKKDTQSWLSFPGSNLAITRERFERYRRISELLDANPEILDLVHGDLQKPLNKEAKKAARTSRSFQYTSDTVLRITVAQRVENLSLREIVIRIDDSHYLRDFTRIYGGPMMDPSVLCRLQDAIRPRTWEKVNSLLTKAAVERGLVSGEKLRLDTTAVETNIHWPSDAGLLWDTVRVLSRLLEAARELDARVVGPGRLRTKEAKRHYTRIGRAVRGGKGEVYRRKHYDRLIEATERMISWAEEVADRLDEERRSQRYSGLEGGDAEHLASEIRRFAGRGVQVVWQASQRVQFGNAVPSERKIVSIFEPETEILVRGKSHRNVEYGHMVLFEQVEGKFITHYQVFPKKPNEHSLLPESLERHRQVFGHYPDQVSGDRGLWPGKNQLAKIEKKVRVLSVGKSGRRNEEDREREKDPEFKEGQRFRAGIEGTISFLKRVLGLVRCFRKGWTRFVTNVGATVFAHNLLILARC